MAVFTRSQASFAADEVPSAEVRVIGIVSQFNDPQLNLRNAGDVVVE
jgi:hypothetical protein